MVTEEIANFISKQKREDVIDALRNTAFSISAIVETTGAPPEYKVYKVNLNTVRCIAWDPIGKWEILPNSVLRLTKSPCEALIMFRDGFEQRFSFQEDDYRYLVDNWLIAYTKKKAECRRTP